MIGVFCREKDRGVSFDECARCAKCLPAPVIRSLKQYDFVYKRNVYHVNDVIGCLRKAYYSRKEPPVDVFHPSVLFLTPEGALSDDEFSASRLPSGLSQRVDGLHLVDFSLASDSVVPQ